MAPARSVIQVMFMIVYITSVNIQAVNLNLLVAFQALLDERSVTHAARRMGVTQPAMSNTLAQLRRLFDDQLFRRTSSGLEPTPRALELAEPVRQGLGLLGTALSEPRFDPKTSDRSFVIAASDYVELVLLPPLSRALEREAPGVRIEVRPWGLHEVPPALARTEADLMVGFYDELPARHRQQLLFEEEYVCVVSKANSRVKGKLTLARWLELGHVLVSQRSESPGSVDRALAVLGKRRRVALRVSHFLMVPMLVANTDFVAALSRRVAEPFASPLRLRLLPPPIALPRGRIGQVWHEQMENDPGHRWFRELVARVATRL
jgi:LysR family transcriptional regulator, mexEF-oprN operon transcriptional activator